MNLTICIYSQGLKLFDALLIYKMDVVSSKESVTHTTLIFTKVFSFKNFYPAL